MKIVRLLPLALLFVLIATFVEASIKIPLEVGQPSITPCDSVIIVSGTARLFLEPADFQGLPKNSSADSVVWAFRSSDIPGVWIVDNRDPREGWVRIGALNHGPFVHLSPEKSSIEWNTNWCAPLPPGSDRYRPCDPTGFYTVMAMVYWYGQVLHSEPLEVFVIGPLPKKF